MVTSGARMPEAVTVATGAIRLHADVAQAVQARDADAAHRAMSEIITEAAGAMLAGGP